MKNIELKFQIADKTGLSHFLMADPRIQWLFCRTQEDIYFNTADGRLKIRLATGQKAQLIFYRRPDMTDARISDYSITPVENPDREIESLTRKYGERGRVRKQRTVYLFRNVRLHLDEVVDLGSFLEFESVIGGEVDELLARENLNFILNLLKPRLGRTVAVGYIDLILAREKR